jgi:hypothetical protein
VQGVAHPVHDVIVALEETQRPASRREVVHVVRRGVGQPPDLVDGRRDDQESEPNQRGDRADVDDGRGGRAPPDTPAALQPLDGGVER